MLVEKGEDEDCKEFSDTARDDSRDEVEAFDLAGRAEVEGEEDGGGRAAEMAEEESGATGAVVVEGMVPCMEDAG